MTSQQRDLFGGAIRALLPSDFIDASDFRQVPDNQEVLVRGDSNISLILEVLQLARDEGADESLDKAIRFHFSSLAHDNSASRSHVETVQVPSDSVSENDAATPKPALLMGTQVVKKFGKESEPDDTVEIFVALWRLPSKDIDLVLSVNQPLSLQINGSSNVDSTPTIDAKTMFLEASQSLQIHDWTLFA